MSTIFAYSGADFSLFERITDRGIPMPHRLAIRRELQKLANFPYEHLIPPKNILRPLGSLYDGTLLYELRPHCPDKTQYRLPLISPGVSLFNIMGFFSRKDAKFGKEIEIANERYKRVRLEQATYELIDLENDTRL